MLRTYQSRAGPGRGVVLASLLAGTFVPGSAEMLTAGLLTPMSSGLGVAVAAEGSCLARTPSGSRSAARCWSRRRCGWTGGPSSSGR